MTALTATAAARRRPVALRTLALAAASVVVAAAVLAIRLRQRHAGLVYPDGYQYLLMARGIAEHLRPVTRLGAGGNEFVPNGDAAAKPLYPVLIAVATKLGVAPRAAAGAISAIAAAAVVLLAAALTLRLTRSSLAAAAAGAVALASPALAYWSGFAGPDALGQALALGAAVALVSRRGVLGGVLAALAVASRPELGVLAVGAAVPALVSRGLRPTATRSVLAGVATLGALLALVRPPLALPFSGAVLLASPVAAVAAVSAAWLLGRSRSGAVAAACAFVAVAVVVATTGRLPALGTLGRGEWPLLACAVVGLVAACAAGARREALVTAAAAGLLAAVYLLKNPGLERYVTLLVPLAAVAAGLGVAALRSASRIAAAAAVAVAALAVVAGDHRPAVGQDQFRTVAAQLRRRGLQGPFVTAAPDAYGFLLPHSTQLVPRAGARGLVVVDGAWRASERRVRIRGRVVARLDPGRGFELPDGTIDQTPVLVVRGAVNPS